jgi:hypothetical protein
MDGLGTLVRIPGDVRRVLYCLQGVAKVLSTLSRALLGECQHGLDHRRRVEPLTAREVVSYLDGSFGTPVTVSAMRLCPLNLSEWNGDLIVLNMRYSEVGFPGVDGGAARRKVEVEYEYKDSYMGYEPWCDARVGLAALEGELILDGYLGRQILQRRLRREGVTTREAYAHEQYSRIIRSALDSVLLPIGYTASRLIQTPLLDGSLDVDPRVERAVLMRLPRAVDTSGLDPEVLLGVLMRLKTVCDAQERIRRHGGPDVSGVDSIPARLTNLRDLLGKVRMNLCVLRDRQTALERKGGSVRARELLSWMRATTKLDWRVDFCLLGDFTVHTTGHAIIRRQNDGQWVRNRHKELARREALMRMLEEVGEGEVVVSRYVGVNMLGDDTAYAALVRGQMSRLIDGTGIDVDTLLRSGEEGWDACEERFCERNVDIRDADVLDPALRERVFRSLAALLKVVYPNSMHLRDDVYSGYLSDGIHDVTGRLAMAAFMRRDVVLPEGTRPSLARLLSPN